MSEAPNEDQYEQDPASGILKYQTPIEKLETYLKIIARPSRHHTKRFPDRPILYRGQRFDRPLLPKIARDPYDYKQRSYPPRSGADDERYMLEQFKRLSPPFLEMGQRPSNDYEWLALARHYGMVTRLLDWTENALAALWFATNEITDQQNCNPVVWTFFPEDQDILSDTDMKSNPFLSFTTRAFQPPHFDSRIRSQSGWFTIHSATDATSPFQPFDQDPASQGTPASKSKLRRVEIAENFLVPIRKQLEDCGVTASLIYPDLTGLCEHLNTVLRRPCR